MIGKRKAQLLHNSSQRMLEAAKELHKSSEEMLSSVEEMENIEDTADAGGVPTPRILRWWGFMRRESWIHLKRSFALWWHIIMAKK